MKIEPFYLSLGKKIQKFRDDKRISQAALGNKLKPKVTRASIANIEAGKQRVLAHTLLQLASALEKDVSELLPRAEVPLSSEELKRKINSELSIKLSPQDAKGVIAYFDKNGRKRK